MNAAADSPLPASPRAMATPHPTHKFRLLLRREFWEHKGGFLWAPLVAGGISLLLTIMAIVIGEVAARQALADGEFDGEVMINGLDLGYLTSKLGPEELRELSQAVDIALYMASGWPLIVLEAMKMEHTLAAPRAATVDKVLVSEGEQVQDGRVLVTLTSDEDSV